MTDIRVVIVDDVERVRKNLCILLTLTGNIEIVGEAQNGIEAIEKAQSLHPDVVLMDLEMPVLDGWAAAQSLKITNPSIFIVALTIHGDLASRQRANQVGVDAFFEKGDPLVELIQAIQKSRGSQSS